MLLCDYTANEISSNYINGVRHKLWLRISISIQERISNERGQKLVVFIELSQQFKELSQQYSNTNRFSSI